MNKLFIIVAVAAAIIAASAIYQHITFDYESAYKVFTR